MSIIDLRTKKIIDIQVANKFCLIYSKEVEGQDKTEHKCYMNYEGSSSGMEAELALISLKNLSDNYNIQGNKLIADGDSSLFKKLIDNLGWAIIKYECINHLIRNYKGNLIDIVNSKGINDIVGDSTINKMCAYCRNVINIYGGKNNRDENKMKQLIKLIPYHIFGYHQNCTEDLCKKPKNDDGKNSEITSDVLELLSNSASNITLKISRVHQNLTTNLAECYHSIRIRLDHGKSRNYIV